MSEKISLALKAGLLHDVGKVCININRIREKLAGIGLTDFIKTKHRQGYTI